MFLYHYTTRERLPAILREGLKPGADVGLGERLPFVLFDRRQYPANGPGAMVFLQVEIADDDPLARPVNAFWVEYCGKIAPECIVRCMVPPEDNGEVIAIYREGGDRAVDARFQYVEAREAAGLLGMPAPIS